MKTGIPFLEGCGKLNDKGKPRDRKLQSFDIRFFRSVHYQFKKRKDDGKYNYVETISEKNVPIYEHFGFRTVDKSTVPETQLVNWAMLRKAQ